MLVLALISVTIFASFYFTPTFVFLFQSGRRACGFPKLHQDCCAKKTACMASSVIDVTSISQRQSFWKWSWTTINEITVGGVQLAPRNGRRIPYLDCFRYKWKSKDHFFKRFISIHFPKFSWTSDVHKWSSRRKPARKGVVKTVKFDFSF